MTSPIYLPRPVRFSIQRLWRDPSIRIPLLIFVASRFLTLAIAFAATKIGGPVYNPYASDSIFVASMQTRNLSEPLTPFVDPWHRWDTGWYMKVAGFGYSATDGSIIFAPLYPLSMRVVGAPVGDTLLGGLVVSSIACLIALILLYKLARFETHSDEAARNALIALMAFPTAFYFMAGYTESLFLACVLGAFYSARKQKWWLAGICAALASLTRLQGWILFFPLGWFAFIEAPRFWQTAGMSWIERIKQSIPRLFATGMGPFTTLCFMVYVSLVGLGSIGDAYSSPIWNVQILPPWASVIAVIGRVIHGTANATEIAGLLALVIIVVFSLAALRVLPVPYHLYSAITLILVLMRFYSPILLNGTMRYVLDFFPIFITLGVLLARRPAWRALWVGVGITFQVILLFAFARWLWVA